LRLPSRSLQVPIRNVQNVVTTALSPTIQLMMDGSGATLL
jgi:hypothetical protein